MCKLENYIHKFIENLNSVKTYFCQVFFKTSQQFKGNEVKTSQHVKGNEVKGNALLCENQV